MNLVHLLLPKPDLLTDFTMHKNVINRFSFPQH